MAQRDAYANVKSAVVIVTTTATQLVTVSNPFVALVGTVTIQNLGAATLFVGGSDVTTANGYQVAVNATYSVDCKSGVLYGIVAAATNTVAVLEFA